MPFFKEVSHPAKSLQDAGRLDGDMANDGARHATEAWEAIAASSGKTIAEGALAVAGIAGAVVFHKPILGKVSEAAGKLGEAASKALPGVKSAPGYEAAQLAAGLTDDSFRLTAGRHLLRIESGGGIREYEAHVPSGYNADDRDLRYRVVMPLDTVLFGKRKPGGIHYDNESVLGLPPNGMPGNGFTDAVEQNKFIAIYPVPQRGRISSGWGHILSFVDVGKDRQFVRDILTDLPRRANVELAPVRTAGSVSLLSEPSMPAVPAALSRRSSEPEAMAAVHLVGMSGGANMVRDLTVRGALPEGTIKSAWLNASPRFPFQGRVQEGIDTLITHGQPASIAGLRDMAARGVEGVSTLLLDSLPRKLGRGDTVVKYEGGPGRETSFLAPLFGHNSLNDSQPFLLFDDYARANGIGSATVVPDISNPDYVRRFAQSDTGTKVEEILLKAPYDGHNFAGRPTVDAGGAVVRSSYRISDLHGPVAPRSVFHALDHWLHFTGLDRSPAALRRSEALVTGANR